MPPPPGAGRLDSEDPANITDLATFVVKRDMNTACQQCRRRKVKCDLKTPRCGNCERSSVRCLSAELTSSRATSSLPPGYLESLESELALLEDQHARISASKSQAAPGIDGDMHSGLTGSLENPSPPFDWNCIGEGNSGRLHPTFSYGLGDMFRSALAVDNQSPYHSKQPNSLFLRSRQSREPVIVANHPLAETYLNAFIDTVQDCLPILRHSEIALFRAVSTGTASIESLPIYHMALAIGAMLACDNNPISSYDAIGFFESAALTSHPMRSDLQTLQMFILVTVFSLFHSAAGSTWLLNGLVIQLAIALGLHHEPSGQTQLSDAANEGKLFWVVYILDRIVSISLGRPLGLSDSDISIKFPEQSPDATNLDVLATLAHLASSTYTWKRGLKSESCDSMHYCHTIVRERVCDHPSSFFRTFAFQLAIWSAADPHELLRSTMQGANSFDDPLPFHEIYLVHYQRLTQQLTPLPWTCAYAIFHAALLTKYLSGLRKLHYGTASQFKESMFVLHSVMGQLGSFFHMFRGLQDLAKMYDQLTSQQPSPAVPSDWEILSNCNSRDAMRLLVGLNKPRLQSVEL